MKTRLSVAATLCLLCQPSCGPAPQMPLSRATMYRKVGESAEVLPDGAAVHPGDQLRACAQGPRGHVSLLGQDGTGAVTIYGTWPVEPGALQCAPFALELDAAPGPEVFWLIASPHATNHVPVARPEDAISWQFEKS